jgi:hypothetical protein
MSVGLAAILLVLVVLVALAAATFFRHALTALMLLVAISAGLVLGAFMGTSFAIFAIGLVVVFATLVHTIGDTLRQLRTSKRTDRRRPPALAEHPASTRDSGRSRIAA